MDQTEQTEREMAFKLIKNAFDVTKNIESSRELSLVQTKLEEAMMWLNKDRVIKGELTPNDTHVQK